MPLPLRFFRSQNVAQERTGTFYFSSSRFLEALGSAFVCFELWHTSSEKLTSNNKREERPSGAKAQVLLILMARLKSCPSRRPFGCACEQQNSDALANNNKFPLRLPGKAMANTVMLNGINCPDSLQRLAARPEAVAIEAAWAASASSRQPGQLLFSAP